MAKAESISVKDNVQVAVNIRPLVGSELLQGCRDCINIVPGGPQIRLGTHTFTFDHVYGGSSSPSSNIFVECVAPLVDGLFHGYNATVLAYGQTGSGKTYTMGTGYTLGGSRGGVIPQAMEMLFEKISSFGDSAQFQIRASFIEILKEEIHDLLDPPLSKCEASSGSGMKTPVPGKPVIQVRESTAGGITLAGISFPCYGKHKHEFPFKSRSEEPKLFLVHDRRSHAIFTISLEQRRKISCGIPTLEAVCEEFLCSKLHLVDLAGSERAKRTGTNGMRFKEGVHINKGLLALGNVISALGEDRKRKEARHVPYRDSKLTRMLQDSLGGNSRTVMIACVSPADSNAEETLNTLKYANRARNILNKPIVNRDPAGSEIQKLRQQLSLLQAELVYARQSECSPGMLEMLKQKLSYVEALNEALRKELEESQQNFHNIQQRSPDAQMERDSFLFKLEKLRDGKDMPKLEIQEVQTANILQSYLNRIHELESQLQTPRFQVSDVVFEGNSDSQNCLLPSELGDDVAEDRHDEIDPETVTAKELEHHLFLRDCMDKELQELNHQLKEKEAEMRTVTGSDQLEKKLSELEEEKKALLMEKNSLNAELEALLQSSDEQKKKMQHTYVQKLKELEAQISDLKKQQDKQAQLLRNKQRSEEAAERLQFEIQRIKQQKVHLHNRIKQESEHFRTWKACREKELLKLRKEGRRNEYEMHKLQALHERQKLVLHRKTKEAAATSRRLKEVLEARKLAARENKMSTKTPQQWLEQELEVAVRLREAKATYEKQSILQEEEASQDQAAAHDAPPSPCASDAPSQADSAVVSTALEAEDNPFRWQQVRTVGGAKDMLSFLFNVAVSARFELRERENNNKDLKDRIDMLSDELLHNERRRNELEDLLALARTPRESTGDREDPADFPSEELQRHHEENAEVEEPARNAELGEPAPNAEPEQLLSEAEQAFELCQPKNAEEEGQAARQHRWSLQFKWKWQKLSQWMRHTDKPLRATSALRVLDVI